MPADEVRQKCGPEKSKRPGQRPEHEVPNTASSGSGRIDDSNGHPQGELRGLTKLVKITDDVRKFAAEQGLAELDAIESGLEQKARELSQRRAEVHTGGQERPCSLAHGS